MTFYSLSLMLCPLKVNMSLNSELGKNDSNWLQTVRQHVNSLKFGVVQIVVHNGRIVQIERTERIRFDQGDAQVASENSGAQQIVGPKPTPQS